MDRVKLAALVVIWLAVVVLLVVWVQILNRRVADLEVAVSDLSTQIDGLTKMMRFARAVAPERLGPPAAVDRGPNWLRRPGGEGPGGPPVRTPPQEPRGRPRRPGERDPAQPRAPAPPNPDTPKP